MSNATPFGIGCFAFEAPKNSSEPYSLDDWESGVRQALEALPQVDDVAIHMTAERRISVGAKEVGDRDSAAERDYMIPQPAAMIDFAVRIPTRIQHEEAPWIRSGHRAPGERFRVRTYYSLYGPATFISCLDDGLDPLAGNNAVVVVWKHLSKHLEGAKSLAFSVIGPSPMHINTVLQPRQQAGAIEWDGPFPTSSRAAANFFFSPEHFDDVRAAEDELQVTFAPELSAYYWTVRRRNRRLLRSMEIGNKTSELIEAHRAPGFRAAARRLFRTGGQARALGLDILDAEFKAAQDTQASEQRISLLYSAGDGPFAKFVRESAGEDFPEYLSNGQSVVNLLEGSRTKEFEVAVVGASTLLGAAAGAVASALT